MDLSTIGDHEIANDAVLLLALKKDGARTSVIVSLRTLHRNAPSSHIFPECWLIVCPRFAWSRLLGSDTYEKIDVEKFAPPGDEAN
jgi:hypothetical protein